MRPFHSSGDQARVADSSTLSSPPSESGSSLHALYSSSVSILDGFLHDGRTLSNDPHLAAAPIIARSLVELNIWAADIGLQDDPEVLDSLHKDAPGLNARVRDRLGAVRDAVADFVVVLKRDNMGNFDSTEDLTTSSKRISNAVGSLGRLAGDISEHKKVGLGTDLASAVRNVLKQRFDPQPLERKGENLVESEIKYLAYSDDETGQERRRRPARRRKHLPASPAKSTDQSMMPSHADAAQQLTKVSKQFVIPSPTTVQDPGTVKSRRRRSIEPVRFQLPQISQTQTRLATLFPGKFGDPIMFSIQVVSLDRLDMCEYVAVSYAWDSHRHGDVKITFVPNDVDKTQSMYTWPHAAEALLRVRRSDVPITIWIDALCMDLANTEENFSIYLWIGEDDRYFKGMGLAWIKRLIHFENPNLLNLDQESRSDWADFLEFSHLPIFRRRWVAQEVILARHVTILLRYQQLQWDEFVDAIMLWQRAKFANPAIASQLYRQVLGSSSPSSLEDQKTSAERLAHVRQYLGQRRVAQLEVGAEELVLSLTWTESSIPHDAIYAFIGLAWGAAKATFEDWPGSLSSVSPLINYSLSNKTLFMRFVSRCIRASGSLDILLRPWAPESESIAWRIVKAWNSSLPSWIQRARDRPIRPTRVSFVGHPSQSKQTYDASAAVYPSYRFADKSTSEHTMAESRRCFKRADVLAMLGELDIVSHLHFLFVDGIDVGTITRLSPRISQGVIPCEVLGLGMLKSGSRSALHINEGLLDDDSFRSLVYTLVAGRTATGDRTPEWYLRAILRCLSDNPEQDLNTSTNASIPAAIAEVLSRIRDVTWNRKLIQVDDKFVGLAPADTEEGDQVCVLFGCSVPVVLRRQLGDPSSYKIVGECFVCSFMEGEAMTLGAISKEFMLV
ncbi:hypothetical protein BDV96DRAFT_641424 [Lophiotrema nucula]|uniref:Heterokaryon incompatibility domain-containing protein n=1 Tax=Lophiotrema nucula TaxID=690887 RepID=A0A6A5ZMZ3_9PLEO|nr:hypothetical protein BDV96DRAFT_641424 [Lophiotrema nucula]